MFSTLTRSLLGFQSQTPCQTDSRITVPLSTCTFFSANARASVQYPERDPSESVPVRVQTVSFFTVEEDVKWHECFFFKFREPGSPLSLVCPPLTRWLLRVRWHHEELNPSTTTLTHQPQSTRVYHHTIIVQPNTVNREGRAAILTRNRWGQRAGKEGDHRMKKTISSTLTLATDVYTTTPSTTTRHSHCLLNLDSTEKDGGIKQTGLGRGSRDIHEGGILFSTPTRRLLKSTREAGQSCWASRLFTDSNRSSHSGPHRFEESVLRQFSALSLFFTSDAFCIIISFLQYESESNQLKTKSKFSFFPQILQRCLCVCA